MAWGSILQGAGALLGAGAGIAGMFQGEQDNYHPEVWRNDMYKNKLQEVRAIRDAANQYGFHPLALLGANTGGSYPAVVGGGSQFGLGDAIGHGANALSALGELYESDQDRIERREDRDAYIKERQRERALDTLRSREITPETRLQRENMQLQNELLRADIATSRSRLAGLRSAAVGGAHPTSLTDAIGIRMTPPAGRASAQEMQDEYGDIVENVYGIGNWMQDMWSAKNPAWWDELWGTRLPSLGSRQPDYVVPVY